MIAIAITTALLAAIPQASASFAWDCSWWYLSGESLVTGCATWGAGKDEKVKVTATLDLNECIGIDPVGNAMVWEKGGQAFREWCGNCAFQNDEVTMQCDCISAKTGGKTTSSIDLDDGLIVMQSSGHPTC